VDPMLPETGASAPQALGPGDRIMTLPRQDRMMPGFAVGAVDGSRPRPTAAPRAAGPGSLGGHVIVVGERRGTTRT